MLYSLNLIEENSIDMLEENLIAMNFLSDLGLSDLDYEDIIFFENYRKLKNILLLMENLLKIGKDDYIWLRYNSEYFLARVKNSPVLNKYGVDIAIEVDVYRYIGRIDASVLNSLDKFLLNKVDDVEALNKSQEIFSEFLNNDYAEEDKLEVEFVKYKQKFFVNNTIGLMPWDKEGKELVLKKSSKPKRRENSDKEENFGELIIELYPPDENECKENSNLPDLIRGISLDISDNGHVNIKNVNFGKE